MHYNSLEGESRDTTTIISKFIPRGVYLLQTIIFVMME
jgi:hypothetical protein